MDLIKELISLWRYIFRTSSASKRIIFYAEHEGYYCNFEGIISELTGPEKQVISYVTSDPGDPVLKTKNPSIKPFYIKDFLFLFFAFVKCRVFVMTMTDLHQFHLKRSVHDVFYIYVFHSMPSIHMTYRQGAFDHYDSVLCVGPHHIQEFTKQEEVYKLQHKELVKAGYYRLERIYHAYQAYRKAHAGQEISRTILIAPHWTENNLLEYCGSRLIDILLRHSYRVIVRPHPETFRRNPELIASLDKEFRHNKNYYLERSVSTDDSLLAADVLISESSGIVFEYVLGTERPVLLLNVPYKLKNENFRDLNIEPVELAIQDQIGALVHPQELDKVPAVIENLIVQREEYKQRLSRLRDQYVYHFGTSSKVGAQHIMDHASRH